VRVPFNSLVLALDCLEQRQNDDEVLCMARESAGAVKRLLDDVSAFHQLATGQATFVHSSFDYFFLISLSFS